MRNTIPKPGSSRATSSTAAASRTSAIPKSAATSPTSANNIAPTISRLKIPHGFSKSLVIGVERSNLTLPTAIKLKQRANGLVSRIYLFSYLFWECSVEFSDRIRWGALISGKFSFFFLFHFFFHVTYFAGFRVGQESKLCRPIYLH